MTFGSEVDEPTAHRIVDRFLDAGGNFFDTADSYWNGRSEEILGPRLKSRRDHVVIATKAALRVGPEPNSIGASKKHLLKSCDRSLRRLQTDYVDVYQLHCWDPATPVDETLSALDELVRAGKVRYVGASNYAGWQIMKACLVANIHGYPELTSLQPQYSLVERSIERDVVPACEDRGIGLIPWGPLGGGFLSGKYRRGEEPPEGSRLSKSLDWMEEWWTRRNVERNWAIVDVLHEVASEVGKTPAQVALKWLTTRPQVVAPILGAASLEQFEDNLGVLGWSLSDEHVKRLTEVSEPPLEYPQRFIRVAMRTRLSPE
jgi:aryl-alcohol dehydrogenase-like predicted oxidoreductase